MNERIFHCRPGDNLPESVFEDRVEVALHDALQRQQIKLHALYGDAEQGVDHVKAFTMVIVEDDNRVEISRGYSFCGPEDQFCRKTGRMIAAGRAGLHRLREIAEEHEKKFGQKITTADLINEMEVELPF